MEAGIDKLDLLNLKEDKSIVKSLDAKGIPLSLRRDHSNVMPRVQVQRLQKKTGEEHDGDQLWRLQSQGKEYHCVYIAIRRKIDIEKIKAITVSKIGTEFVLHVPEEYDYRYASEKREKIIYSILKAYCAATKEKMPIYAKEELSLVNVANTKEDKKKKGIKDLTGDLQVHAI
jgi:hypothetical protein